MDHRRNNLSQLKAKTSKTFTSYFSDDPCDMFTKCTTHLFKERNLSTKSFFQYFAWFDPFAPEKF